MKFFALISRFRTLVPSVALALALTSGIAHAAPEAMLLVEAETGKVLKAENATYPWYPASLTKLMTTYVTLHAVKEGRVHLDTLLTVSPLAASQAPSKMGFKAGTQLTVDNALKMLLVHSANDMAVVLAEGVGGGNMDTFVDEMNRSAEQLGMVQSHFVNPNGLPAEGHVSSARDLAILARALIRTFPEYDYFWHIGAIKFGKRTMRNYNSLLGRYPNIDGMKTGFICASGFNLIATATRNGKRLIAVVMGAPSSPVRAVQAAQMLENGFNRGPLNWLSPNLGKVDDLAPIAAAPPDLHDQMCGPHRKRPAAEEAEDNTVANANDPNSPYAILLANLKHGKGKTQNLMVDIPTSTMVVYTGPARSASQLAAAPEEPDPAAKPAARRKSKSKAAAKPVAAPVAKETAKDAPKDTAKETPKEAAKTRQAAKPGQIAPGTGSSSRAAAASKGAVPWTSYASPAPSSAPAALANIPAGNASTPAHTKKAEKQAHTKPVAAKPAPVKPHAKRAAKPAAEAAPATSTHSASQ